MKTDPAREALIKAMAQLETHRAKVTEAQRRLTRRAQDQLDSMPAAIDTVEQHVAVGRGGDILAQRRLRTLLQERNTLARYLGPRERAQDAEDEG